MMRFFGCRPVPVLSLVMLFALAALLAPADAGTAWYDIRSNPSGAWACVDGSLCEYTPIIFAQDPQTRHTITVSMDGYETYRDSIGTGSDGTTTYIHPNLRKIAPADGWLNINTDAEVTIDGREYGNAMVISLSPGSHVLLLKKTGFDDYSETFSVTGGETTYLSPVMTKSDPTGSIRIDSTPSGAAIWLDTAYRGTTPATLSGIDPGSHAVTIRMDGYQDWSVTTNVQTGTLAEIAAELVPSPAQSPTRKSPASAAMVIAALGICACHILVFRKR